MLFHFSQQCWRRIILYSLKTNSDFVYYSARAPRRNKICEKRKYPLRAILWEKISDFKKEYSPRAISITRKFTAFEKSKISSYFFLFSFSSLYFCVPYSAILAFTFLYIPSHAHPHPLLFLSLSHTLSPHRSTPSFAARRTYAHIMGARALK